MRDRAPCIEVDPFTIRTSALAAALCGLACSSTSSSADGTAHIGTDAGHQADVASHDSTGSVALTPDAAGSPDAGARPDAGAPKDSAPEPHGPILGSGDHRYEWVPGWAKLPAGVTFGYTHGGVVMDSKQRVFMNSDSPSPTFIFDTQGTLLKRWGNHFEGGLHTMNIIQEKGEELMYVAHHGALHQVVKTTLDGDVRMALPFPGIAGVYKDETEYKPTGVAVAPNGDVYVADGYGLSWIHQYDSQGGYIRSWGGKGTDPGQFDQTHCIFLDTRKATPTLIVCDRLNHRLQIFDLDGKFQSMVTDVFGPDGLPSAIDQQGQDLLITDLNGRLTILDKDNKLLVHLGENTDKAQKGNPDVDPKQWKDGQFMAPHYARWDKDGNLFVLEWCRVGRFTKLKRLR